MGMPSVLSEMAVLEERGHAPWQRSIAEFMAAGPGQRRIEVQASYAASAESLEPELAGLAGTQIRSWSLACTPAEGFLLHESGVVDSLTDVQHIFVTSPEGDVVAAFMGGDLLVREAWRGRGIGAELVLARAILHDNGVRDGCLYSPGGLAAARRAHAFAIQAARQAHLATGDRVPTAAPLPVQ